MSKIWFFTGETSIVSPQIQEDAFGNLLDDSNNERYNLENKFSLNNEAPAYAITKSFVLAIEDSLNSNLLNIALLPVNTYTSGFPIKLFIYRGIKKSSLIDSQQNIKESDSTWRQDNILNVVKDLQTKINSKNNTNNIAKSESLGCHYSSAAGSTLIEKIIFDDTDNFHPLIVEGGCQIGKFHGGTVSGGIQVVLEKIGFEPNLELLKKSKHIFEIQKLNLASIISEKEKLKEKFKNRYRKEEVLGYLDITAFYGSAKNQKIKIKNLADDDNFLSKFLNRNRVYIDIRDNRGSSYNHFYKLNDKVKLGFYSSSSTSPVFNEYDYYLKWPILALENKIYETSKKSFFLKIPIHLGTPINSNIISSYTGRISTEKDRTKKYHFLVAEEIGVNHTEAIKIENWKYNDNKLGANYILLKQSRSSLDEFTTNVNDKLLNNIFSLQLNPLFDFGTLQEGEFTVNIYSSLNNPVLSENNGSGYFLPTIGIAVDSKNVTLFYFKEQALYSQMKKSWTGDNNLINKGKYKLKFDSQEYTYTDSSQKVGFLNHLLVHLGISSMKLTKYSFSDAEQNINSFQFATYTKINDEDDEEKLYNFKSITLSLQEFMTLKNHVITSSDFPDYPKYLVQKNTSIIEYGSNQFSEIEVSLSSVIIAESEDDPTLVSIDLVPVEDQILLDNEPISLTALI